MKITNKKKSIITEYNLVRNKNQRKKICHAPFKSLRFSQSGNVLACCFNRGFVLGKYPEKSIHDIWFGKDIKMLRKHINNHDLSYGCCECSRRIENSLFDLSGSLQYDYLAEFGESKYPLMFDFEISNVCNLECVMCLGENSSTIRTNREKLPPYKNHYDNNFVEQIKEFIPYLKEVRFSGGEPFLTPLYYKIWDMIMQINPKIEISILTNATILNDRIKKMLDRGNFHVSVSFDSFQKENYERIRKNAVFEKALENMEYFYSYALIKNKTFNLNVCAMRNNWKDIPKIFQYCNEKNIIVILHTVLFPPAESLWASGSSLLKEILDYFGKENIQSDSSIGKKNIKSYIQFLNQIKKWIVKACHFEESKSKLLEKSEIELELLLKQHLFNFLGLFSENIVSMLHQSELNENDRKNILINLLSFSPDLIVSEFIHNEPDKLLLRLKMFNFNTP